ncbi:MAG: hypothetical protein WDM91_07355 [Rhizomicrobium sp.]
MSVVIGENTFVSAEIAPENTLILRPRTNETGLCKNTTDRQSFILDAPFGSCQ